MRAWIQFFSSGNSVHYTPNVQFSRPTKSEIETAAKFGSHFCPCVITYTPLPLKKRHAK